MDYSEFESIIVARIDHAKLGRPPCAVAQALSRYLALLRRWNSRINLTALALDPPKSEAIDRLIVEPLVAEGKLSLDGGRWFDLGSGGGSPAIPIKLYRPRLELTMVESKSKKTAFLNEAIRDLDLQSARVDNTRFEALLTRAELAGSADLVTVRAVKADDVLLDTCRHLLRPGGRLIIFGFTGEDLSGFKRDTVSGSFERCSTWNSGH